MLRCSFVADNESRRRLTATQAVAIAMEGDTRLYEDDVFYGHQDTLLAWDSTASAQLRQYVYGSAVEGDADFISRGLGRLGPGGRRSRVAYLVGGPPPKTSDE